MAKAKARSTRPAGRPSAGRAAPSRQAPRGPVTPQRTGRSSYFREVINELTKVTWPSRSELIRMTQIVLATVVVFAIFIGALDLLLSVVVKRLYTDSGTTTIQH